MRVLDKIADKFRVKLREKVGNPILAKYRTRKLVNKDFTIISNNCWGGHVYRYFQLPYDSPTIGLYFFADDYVKFVYNIKEYINSDITFIDYRESKYCDILKSRNEINIPIGRINDVEIIFLHYKSEQEAKEKWDRRKARIHWDNIIYKMSEQNLCSKEQLKRFDELAVDKKLIFTTKDYGLTSQVIFRDYQGCKEIVNDVLHFRKFVNIIDLINNGKTSEE